MRTQWVGLAMVIATTTSSACGGDEPGAGESVEPRPLVDVNPAPGVVEVALVAGPSSVELLPGKLAQLWTFRDGNDSASRGSMPGPLLDVQQGDRVIVHFRNELPEHTTIHWHGLRVPNSSDGTPVSQVPVPPGGTFDYEFVVEDAGLFWYHPHMHGDVQVERGLYAPIRVRSAVEPTVAADRVLVLDDVKIEAGGQLSTTTDNLDIMLGRQGNVVLVNGRVSPEVTAAPGSRERWRVVNTANGRYFNLELPGHRLLVIGWDGGLLAEPYQVDTLLVAPGERYEILVELAGAPGDRLRLRTVHYDRGHDIPNNGPIELLTLNLTGAALALPPLPERWGGVMATAVDSSTPRRAFVLEENDEGAEPTFSINGERYPDVTPVVATADAVEVWEIDNRTEMDHPFHLHGMFFQVLDAAGIAPVRLGWKDTVNVPRESTVSVAVQYRGLGRWMYHCHILEHAERGMTGELVVSERAAAAGYREPLKSSDRTP
jgi:FtsP/CotA-like multicopper oxidase with cupredoxin domain